MSTERTPEYREDMRKIAEALKALPEDMHAFTTRYFYGVTTDTGRVCGCAVGNLGKHLLGSYQQGQWVNKAIGVSHVPASTLFHINDAYKCGDHTEAACRARYAYVVAECERLAEAGDGVPE